MALNISKLKFNKFNNLKGFSLLELVIVLIVSAIVLGGITNMLIEFMRTHRRQERVNLIERSLEASENSLKDNLITLPGRGLATSNGTTYEIPNLCTAGTIFDGTKNIPIRLGIITPYKINGNDAFTVLYSDTKVPRLSVDASSATQVGTTRTVRIPLPKTNQSYQFGAIKGDITDVEEPKDNGNSTDTISPVPTLEMFEIGQLMLITEVPNFSSSTTTGTTTSKQVTFATLVKIARVIKTSAGDRDFLQFTLDVCQNGGCGQLGNDPLATLKITSGSTLVPIKFASFYLKKDQFGNKLVRNDGGLILPSGSGLNGETFNVIGGTEIIVGETDSLTVSYQLKDGSTVPTPNSPTVSWIKGVVSVDVTVEAGMRGNQGSEYTSRTRKVNFPVLSENLE